MLLDLAAYLAPKPAPAGRHEDRRHVGEGVNKEWLILEI